MGVMDGLDMVDGVGIMDRGGMVDRSSVVDRLGVVDRVDSVTGPLDLGVESVMVISSVVDLPGGAVGLLEHVVALHCVPVSGLVLTLYVAGVTVVNTVFERVVSRCLSGNINRILALDRRYCLLKYVSRLKNITYMVIVMTVRVVMFRSSESYDG